jgi:DnaK suppressor protein
LPSKKTKKPAAKPLVKKTVAPKKPVAKKAAPKTTAKAAVKKPVVKKVAPKAVAKAVVKKAPAKKPVVKKVAVKKAAPQKAVAKKVAPKAVKKPAAKAAPKKVIATKKPVAKSTLKKPVVAAKAAKSHLSVVPAAKKPLAPLKESKVKASAATFEITPIKAPQMSVVKPKPTASTKNSMTHPVLPADYEPTDTEEFMSPVMKEYFRQRLIAWRDELLRESEETLHTLHEEGNMQKPDITDRASEETDLAIEFRTRDRERKLLNKINEAMGRIEDNSYGYCEETGDPIPVKRLIARPTAVRTLEAEELHERRERTQRDQYE